MLHIDHTVQIWTVAHADRRSRPPFFPLSGRAASVCGSRARGFAKTAHCPPHTRVWDFTMANREKNISASRRFDKHAVATTQQLPGTCGSSWEVKSLGGSPTSSSFRPGIWRKAAMFNARAWLLIMLLSSVPMKLQLFWPRPIHK